MTKYGPYAETTPRGQTGWLDGRRPVAEHARRMLSSLDGESRFTYIIWRGVDTNRIIVTRKDAGETFLQTAGSSEGLTVEVRRVVDGQARLCTIGRREPQGAETSIPMSPDRAVRVFANEVFTVDEAAAIFAEYTDGHAVPARYEPRELDLDQDQSVKRRPPSSGSDQQPA